MEEQQLRDRIAVYMKMRQGQYSEMDSMQEDGLYDEESSLNNDAHMQ